MQNSGHLRLCQQPRAAHALRSDQKFEIVSYKEEMSYKYGYDSNEETTEDEIEKVDDKVTESEKKNCDLCAFKGKTAGGLKTHVTKKHREK